MDTITVKVSEDIRHPLIMHTENIKDMRDRNTSVVEMDSAERIQQTVRNHLRDSMTPTTP